MMFENIENYIENLLFEIENNNRLGFHPMLRFDWPQHESKQDAYLSVNEKRDSFVIQLNYSKPFDKKIGKLSVQMIRGSLNLTGDEEDDTYLVISFPSKERRYYLQFAVDCCVNIKSSSEISQVEKILAHWMRKWKLKRLSSREKRIGIFGELLVLEHILSSKKETDWRIWQERVESSGLHDFVFDQRILEVKSTTQSDGKGLIHVFDSLQFEHSNNLFLIFLRLAKDEETGRSLNKLCSDVRNEIIDNERENFDDVISALGHPFPENSSEIFKLAEALMWKSSPNGPFLQQIDLRENNRAIADISYSISEENIPFEQRGDMSVLGNLIN